MADEEITWKVASWLWDRKDDIGRKLGDLYRWFRGQGAKDPERGILILGPGGVGKTTLGRILAGEMNWLTDAPWEYEESVTEVVVPPGQEHRRESSWNELLGNVSADRYRGIILVSAYGYHDLALRSYRQHALYQGNKDEFVRAYTADRRAEEIQVLRQLAPHLKASPGRVWLVSVVAKEDLWYPDRHAVEQHYRDGDYGAEIRGLLAATDRRHVRHEYAFASLVISNFDAAPNERLVKNVEGYDHRLQVGSVRRLIEILDALRTWEGQT